MEDKQLEDALAETIQKSFNDSELEDILNEIENLEKVFSDESATSEGGDGLKLEQAKPNDLQEAIDAEVASIANEMESVLDENPQAQAEEVSMSDSIETEEPMIEPEQVIAEDTDDIFAQAEAEVEALAEPEAEVTAEPIVAEESDDEEVAFTADEIAAIEESVADMIDETEEVVSEAAPEVTQDDVMDAVMEQIEADEEATDNVVLFNNSEQTSPAPAPVASPSASSSQVDFNAAGSMDLNINFNVAGQSANLKVENGGLTLHMNGVQLTISEESGCSVQMDGGVQFTIPLDKAGAHSDSKKDAA